MMTPLSKPVRRLTFDTIRSGGQTRRLAVALLPGGLLGLRLQGTRREETLSLSACWSLAIKQRVAYEQAAKKKQKLK